jgi:alcohol dehydrogenase class IV
MAVKEMNIIWPGRLLFGAGVLRSLGDEAKGLGKRAMVATTKDLVSLGLAERVGGLLKSAGLSVTLYDSVLPDPTSQAVDEAAEIARAAACDLVIGLGGGSAIDFAKGVAVAATHPGSIWEYITYTGANAKPLVNALLPVVAIPTTAGTGSEATQGTVLDNEQTKMKAALLNPQVYPRLALVDPELTYTMPKTVTAMTGFDALTHGIEAYLNLARSNPVSDLYALETVRRVSRSLPRVLSDPNDRDARAEMSLAATFGGVSIALSNATVAHAMGLPMGARLGTPHGLALSRLLPPVLDRSWKVQPARCAELADAAGASSAGMTTDEKARQLCAWLRRFIAELGLDKLWTGVEIGQSMAETLAADVFAYMGRPVQQHQPVFTPSEMREMFREALFG